MRSTLLRILPTNPSVLYYDRTPYFLRSVRVSRICVAALPFTRMMSSSPPPAKHLFAVYAPDYTDPGVLERRFSVRERHLKGIDGMLDSGVMSMCICATESGSHDDSHFLLRIWGSPLGTGTH